MYCASKYMILFNFFMLFACAGKSARLSFTHKGVILWVFRKVNVCLPCLKASIYFVKSASLLLCSSPFFLFLLLFTGIAIVSLRYMVPSSGTGEDGLGLVTVENCGNDFLASLADATQPTDDWDDLKGIETEACGNLNDMLMKNVTDCNGGVAMDSNYTFREPNLSSQRAPDHFETSAFASDDSDFEMCDEIDNVHDNHSSMQRQAQSRNSGVQSRSSAKSTVCHLF